MVIQQPALSLSVLVLFREEKERIIEESQRRCFSLCVFPKRLNIWKSFLIQVMEVIGACIFEKYFTLGYQNEECTSALNAPLY
jgi:hypothetical protein